LSPSIDISSPFYQAIKNNGAEGFSLFSAGIGQKMNPSNLLLSTLLSSWFFGKGGNLDTIYILT
jgi:hypothetical protein